MTLARRPAWLTLALGLLLLAVAAVLLVPWSRTPGPVPVEDVFTAREIARSEEYSAYSRTVGLAATSVALAVALWLGFSRTGAELVRRAGGHFPWWLTVPVGAVVVLLVGRVATLPFALLGRRLRLDYGLTEQTWGAWVVDYAKSFGVTALVASIVLLVLVASARRWPRWWFAVAGTAAAGLVAVLSFLHPVVVEPVFNKFEPMPPSSLRSSVLALAERQEVAVDSVLVADASRRTTTLNAYVSGYGETRRVVVYDTLLESLPDEEVLMVVAHELAHAKHRDVPLGTALGAMAALVGVVALALLVDTSRLRRRAGVWGPGDPAAVALMLALVSLGSFLSSPAQNAMSRAVEVRADRTALEAVADPAVFESLQRELVLHSLADPTPPRLLHWWFASHPTVLERIALAREAS